MHTRSLQPPIEDYGLIGDTHSAALVSKAGSIDWLCLPSFDSPSCFAAILDGKIGGHWIICPHGGGTCARRQYRKDSMILESVFETQAGSVVLVDFLALEDPTHGSHPRAVAPREIVVRLVKGLSGRVRMHMRFEPRFVYGEVIPWIRPSGSAVEAIGGPDALRLSSNVDLTMGEGQVTSAFAVEAGRTIWFQAAYRPSHLQPLPSPDPQVLLEQTESFWLDWIDRCTYQGEHRDELRRSLLTLKALTFSPSGGVVAAPTTSLPEKLGGSRNWDYRMCWLRDATFVLDTFLDNGFVEEAREWRDWLARAVAGRPADLQVMYGLLGKRRLPERDLALSGYRSSKPVRVGNAAHRQFQLDVYGEVMDSFHSARRAGIDHRGRWELERQIVDFVCQNWRRPDHGIWEVRSAPRHFVHSKVMAWVAIDRGIKAIRNFGMPGPLDHWRTVRDRIKWDVLLNGVDKPRGRFKRAYEDEELDASLLLLPQVGFIDPRDPLMVRTVEAIQRELVHNDMVIRYRTEEVDDGLPPGEGAFLICSYWLVDCLALIGRHEEASRLLQRLNSSCNDLGLLSEQYDPAMSRMLGNFPQAFSHLALIDAVKAVSSSGETPMTRRGHLSPSASPKSQLGLAARTE